ncbi:MAG TPA: DDE-type integrase/transposase/recombinase, partial [Planctomycetota bacterium]|nr:DDE-type integrase/transposase/recombinase [Planctomycetota bacterium]
MGAVLDLFSRKVMALDVAPQEPDAAFACWLLSRAVRRHGMKPRCIVSDHGVQFTSSGFPGLLARRKIRRRY